MVVVIKKDAPPSAMDDALKAIAEHNRKTKKGFDSSKFAGKLVRGLDGMEYQKMMRDEWR